MNADLQSRDLVTPLRLMLLTNGYNPVPIAGPQMRCKSPGKQPVMRSWQQICAKADEAEVRRWAIAEPDCTNTGLLCGLVVGADLDVPVPSLSEVIKALATKYLGHTRLHRIGQAPKSLLAYRTTTPLPKMATPELFLPCGTKVQVEILGAGQQFVAYGVHPVTGLEYEWPNAGPDVVPLAELPLVTEATLREFVTAAEAELRAAGGLTSKEITRAAGEAANAPDVQPRPEPTAERTKTTSRLPSGAGGDKFFKQVNRAALDNPAAWVLQVFPKAQRQAAGGYRVTSVDLGRGYEEDLSIHPSGVQDFGPRKGLSPCDVVMEWGGARSVQEAAHTLCEWMGRPPEEFGWKARAKPKAKQESRKAEANADISDVLLTEHGVALAFMLRQRDQLRFCHDTGAWFIWTGTHWKQDRKHVAFSFARDLIAQANHEAEFKTQAITGKAAFAAGVERFARADQVLAVTVEDWDTHPWLLATPGGTVDLRTGTLRPALPGDMMTRITASAPAETADCPRWLRFMNEVTAEDAALIRFLRQWCGYCLTGDTREQALLFGSGQGGNGKGVLLNTVSRIMGDYAMTAAMEAFTASSGDKHSTDLAMLRGARMVTASETEEGRAWAESRIKQVTGGDPITARFMRQDNFTYLPQFKLTIIGNHKPVLRNVDDAMRRRFNIVPFLHKPKVVDPQLEATLRREWPGILRWMIEGCLDWQRHKLLRPSVVVEATTEYFEAQDIMAHWLAERCEEKSTAEAASSALYRDWAAWAKARGEEPGTNKAFSAAMERRHAKRRANAGVVFLGLRLRPNNDGVW